MSKYSSDQLILVDGIRVNYDEYSFSICRSSNTTPVLTLRFESDNQDNLEKIKNDMLNIIAKVISDINY
jgi:phosphomannomutase/phosphoglucomutase